MQNIQFYVTYLEQLPTICPPQRRKRHLIAVAPPGDDTPQKKENTPAQIPTSVDIFYLSMNIDKKPIFLDYLPATPLIL